MVARQTAAEASARDEPAQDSSGPARERTLLGIVDGLRAELTRDRSAPRARLEDSLERDLGFDSLARVELLLRIQRGFKVDLPTEVLERAETVADIARARGESSTVFRPIK